MPSHQDQNAAVLDQFTRQAESYAALVGQSAGRAGPGDPVALSGVSPEDEVLDVACGAGSMTLDFARAARRVTGIDLTSAMLAQARALQAERGVDNVAWVQGDVLPLPFADAAFDVVVTRASFHHMADPAAVLGEMRRAARPGGRIVVSDLTPAADKGPALDRLEILRDPSHVHALPADDLRILGRAAGLQELHVAPYAAELPLEAVLATSFPGPAALDEVRALVAADADEGADRLGMAARRGDGGLYITYPMTTLVWRKPQG
ncbi:class I SAM-dependent methyltransferase [Phenylobacterium sp.]|jgi:SAM-dependent methyltransferase|uniref:class I SAM-dependent methyltransferase n=1 Tax=Phenylobacterium sp. TaxID=1871053 RepID=UPI002F3EDF5E